MNKKIYLICHGLGEQLFLEGMINKYISKSNYIPIETLSPNKKVHKSSVQINNLLDTYRKSLIAYRDEIKDKDEVFIIFMVDSQERDQDKILEEKYVTGQLNVDLENECNRIVGKVPKVCCLYSVRGIESAILEVYPELQEKNGVTHIQRAKPHLDVELFESNAPLAQSNLDIIKSFIDDNVL